MEQEDITGAELLDLIFQLRYCCEEQDEQIRANTDLSPAEYRGINSIHAGSTITASQFAKQVGLSPSRSSRVIEKMDRAGYLSIEPSKEDRRSIIIRLAPEGLAIKKEIERQSHKCHQKIDENLTPEERRALHDGVRKLLDYL